MIYVKMFHLCSLLGVFWFPVLHLGHIVLLTLATRLYITSPGIIYFLTGHLYLLKTFTHIFLIISNRLQFPSLPIIPLLLYQLWLPMTL